MYEFASERYKRRTTQAQVQWGVGRRQAAPTSPDAQGAGEPGPLAEINIS
jgi:hypothetical protein